MFLTPSSFIILKGEDLLRNGMSIEMYNFILDNKDKIKYNLEEGLIITPKNTNGTVCTSTGYLRVKVNNKTLQVHQILSVIYFGIVNIGMSVNHINGDKLDNRRENLEVVSISENIKLGFETGLYDSIKRKVEKYDKQGNLLEIYDSVTEACKENNINTMSDLIKALKGYRMRDNKKIRVKSLKGFIWKYN